MAAPPLIVGSVAHAAKAAAIPDGLISGIEAHIRRAHVLSGLPVGGETPPEQEPVETREAHLLVVFASSLVAHLLGGKEEQGTEYA